MPTLEDLRLRTGQLITEDWFDALVDYLEQIGYGEVISVYGYVMKDLVPIQDLLLNLGIPLKRFKELHVGSCIIKDSATIDGKNVIKDGDPLTISDFGATAEADIKNNVRDGVDASSDIETIKSNIASILAKLNVNLDTRGSETTLGQRSSETTLLALKNLFIPVRVGIVWESAVSAMTDLFSPDITVASAGRIRWKVKVGTYSYLYCKHKGEGQGTNVYALLNAGVQVPPSAWHEWDFTVIASDTVNLQVSEGTVVTVVAYNIPNA